jgi:hypothetical protein
VLAAEAKNARKPDSSRLGAAREKARARFDARSARALEKAAGRGVSYGGATGSALGDAAEAIADTRVQATTP